MSVDVSKTNAYVVQAPNGIELSKLDAYVVQAPINGVQVAKVNMYLVYRPDRAGRRIPLHLD